LSPIVRPRILIKLKNLCLHRFRRAVTKKFFNICLVFGTKYFVCKYEVLDMRRMSQPATAMHKLKTRTNNLQRKAQTYKVLAYCAHDYLSIQHADDAIAIASIMFTMGYHHNSSPLLI